ncbi:MAG: hypothetical protein NZM06_02105 [Chloroherpetonaceae bacterium]|nr:hypothetical protein [Chloroherpetonaceae bacterium]MDW8438437.1 hypothetical protein [Chloroherpetonaceae bacterium]
MRKLVSFLASLATVASLSLAQIGCGHEHDENKHGNITTLEVILTDGSTTIRAKAVDLDGDGGNPPRVDSLFLPAGRSFSGRIELLDESKNPPQSRTEEIRRDADTHRFRFSVSGGAQGRVIVSNLDRDSKGQEFGMRFDLRITSGAATQGSLRITLEHHDTGDKSAGIFDTDIDATFPVLIGASAIASN